MDSRARRELGPSAQILPSGPSPKITRDDAAKSPQQQVPTIRTSTNGDLLLSSFYCQLVDFHPGSSIKRQLFQGRTRDLDFL